MIQFDRLRDAYFYILDNVQDEAVRLNRWACDTYLCAAGHIAQAPDFRTLRFWMVATDDGTDSTVLHVDSSGARWYGYNAISKFFGLDDVEATILFGSRIMFGDIESTDRQIWLKRIEKFFINHGKKLERRYGHDPRSTQ